ncbi:prepilin peptidase [Sanguibacter massiliensis]|uniref:prepilin peptidase n=1 Tax=Sanguibacter massiliensis TaxID=1973217 RepID=UPI000C84D119|nr:A24 family peptidase [Sanguibacter massiliensis]
MLVALFTLAGLLIGSFLNVVVHRVPAGASVVDPPSACPSCGSRIRWFDNVPVVSWLALRGRCRDCTARISVRYPLLEATTGVLFAATAAWTLDGSVGSILLSAVLCYVVAVAVALVLIDVEHHRLPDAIVLPSIYVVVVGLAVVAAVDGAAGRLVMSVVSAAVLYAVYLVIAVVYPAGMGGGDVKLAALIGLVLGWYGIPAVIVGWFAGFVVGGIVGVVVMVTRRSGRKTMIPFGPAMIVGAAIGVLWGAELAQIYLDVALSG